jgi:hypothetical protein
MIYCTSYEVRRNTKRNTFPMRITFKRKRLLSTRNTSLLTSDHKSISDRQVKMSINPEYGYGGD